MKTISDGALELLREIAEFGIPDDYRPRNSRRPGYDELFDADYIGEDWVPGHDLEEYQIMYPTEAGKQYLTEHPRKFSYRRKYVCSQGLTMSRGAMTLPFEETRRYEVFVVVCQEAADVTTLPPLNTLYRIIGARLNISPSTARFHVAWLLEHDYLLTNKHGAPVVNGSKLLLPTR